MPGVSELKPAAVNKDHPEVTASLRGCNVLFIGILPIVLGTFAAYSPVLFNFFLGDDFVHLTWLSQAVDHPELVWRNFYSSWLDGTTTRFYRPLISVFMLMDYKLWGINGLGFRITNLVFHLLSVLFVFLIVTQLSRSVLAETRKHSRVKFFAVVAAATFALYPSHPEAVSWITGRVDGVVTAFCLASFWQYLRWRSKGSWWFFALAAITFLLALFSKEMAITLPGVFFAYEVCFKRKRRNIFPEQSLGQTGKITQEIGAALLPVMPFFFILGVYFLLRKQALGTFVGGYDDSLFFIADVKGFVLSWIHALRMMLVPINKEVIGTSHLLTKAWELLLILSGLLVVRTFIKQPELRSLFLFLLFWLACSLVPVYKIFSIADDLQGSRMAYLATAPLGILLALAATAHLTYETNTKAATLSKIWSLLPTVALICLSFILLQINNMSWMQAGFASNCIRQELSNFYTKVKGDPQVLILGLPDAINGAYVCRNALWGMTKYPQLVRSVNNCLMINAYEPIFPFGFLKNSIWENKDNIKIFHWNSNCRQLVPIHLQEDKAQTTQTNRDLLNANQALTIKQTSSRLELILPISAFACWPANILSLEVDFLLPLKKEGLEANLLYANDLHPQFDLRHRVSCALRSNLKAQSLIFPLHSLPAWAFGGDCKGLKLLLPEGAMLKVKSLKSIEKEQIMPRLDFANSGYLGSKGFLHLSSAQKTKILNVDVSAMRGATTIEIEITRPNLLFEEQNSRYYSTRLGQLISAAVNHGTSAITLKRNQFLAPGIYELRARARNKERQLIGMASDHIVIAVE